MTTSTKVAEAWLKTLPFVDASMVGPTLPSSSDTWGATGFWQVTTIGGTPNVDLGTREPVIEISCWAATPDSEFAPYNRAERMSNEVLDAAIAARTYSIDESTFFLGVSPVTEPMRIRDSRTGFARVAFNSIFWWGRK